MKTIKGPNGYDLQISVTCNNPPAFRSAKEREAFQTLIHCLLGVATDAVGSAIDTLTMHVAEDKARKTVAARQKFDQQRNREHHQRMGRKKVGVGWAAR